MTYANNVVSSLQLSHFSCTCTLRDSSYSLVRNRLIIASDRLHVYGLMNTIYIPSYTHNIDSPPIDASQRSGRIISIVSRDVVMSTSVHVN